MDATPDESRYREPTIYARSFADKVRELWGEPDITAEECVQQAEWWSRKWQEAGFDDQAATFLGWSDAYWLRSRLLADKQDPGAGVSR